MVHLAILLFLLLLIIYRGTFVLCFLLDLAVAVTWGTYVLTQGHSLGYTLLGMILLMLFVPVLVGSLLDLFKR